MDLLRSPSRCRALGEALQRRVEKEYGPERVLDQVARTYALALGAPR